MAMSGFEGFTDSPEAPFYRAVGRSPQETWEEATDRLTRLLRSLGSLPASQIPAISVDRIVAWHRAIFATTFPLDAGRLRLDHERSQFSLPILRDGERVTLYVEGVRTRAEIKRQLDEACSKCDAARRRVRQRTHSVRAAAAPAAELYSKVLEVHPFVDGNLRAAFVALQAALLGVGLPAVTFRHAVRRHDDALGWAMRRDSARSLDPLVDLIAELLSTG